MRVRPLPVLAALTVIAGVLVGCTPPPPDRGVVATTGPAATGATVESAVSFSGGDDGKTDSMAERLREPGRWATAATPPVMPDPNAGRPDQFLGARGSAGTTCVNGQASAWLTTAGEHVIVDDKEFFRDTPLTDTLTGGVVRLTATTPDGAQPLVEYVLPDEDDPVKWHFDLQRTEGLGEVLAVTGQTPDDPAFADLQPGDVAGLVARTNPADDGTTWFRTFEIFAPDLPLPTGTTASTLTYELDGYDPVTVDIAVARCR